MRQVVAVGAYNSSLGELRKTYNLPDELTTALAAIFWALSNNADDFPVAPGYKSLRQIKTAPVGQLPPLRAVFTIIDDQTVNLKWIEVADTPEFRGPPLF